MTSLNYPDSLAWDVGQSHSTRREPLGELTCRIMEASGSFGG